MLYRFNIELWKHTSFSYRVSNFHFWVSNSTSETMYFWPHVGKAMFESRVCFQLFALENSKIEVEHPISREREINFLKCYIQGRHTKLWHQITSRIVINSCFQVLKTNWVCFPLTARKVPTFITYCFISVKKAKVRVMMK